MPWLAGAPRPRVVVGVDFGTTFSGFAYAHVSEPDSIFTFHSWPEEALGGGRPYCKTRTALLYDRNEDGAAGQLQLKSWGWPALVTYTRALQKMKTRPQQQERTGYWAFSLKSSLAGALRYIGVLPPTTSISDNEQDAVGVFITHFKLLLAGVENERAASCPLQVPELPPGLSVIQAITDYLSKISDFVMDHLRLRFNNSLTMQEVQWCLTVPAIWDDVAKQKMRLCAQKAGMVSGSGSPHELIIVLEPEAASVYCFKNTLDLAETIGDQFLVVDIGGGTTDIVVHERASLGRIPKIREVKRSSGGLCGGSYVDQNFRKFLAKTVGGFDAYVEKNPATMLSLLGWWEGKKCGFDGRSPYPLSLELPHGVTKAWMEDDLKRGRTKSSECFYEEIEVSLQDMKNIFDPIVQQVIQLMDQQMSPKIKVIMVVGGFSASPYLVSEIRKAFGPRVQQIISPPDPGSAICQGAVSLGIASDNIILSRVSRKTYGIRTTRPFTISDPVAKRVVCDGEAYCWDIFTIFARRGEEIDVDHCVTRHFGPVAYDQRTLKIAIFSSSEVNPQYTTDDGVVLEGSFVMDISDGLELQKLRKVEASMFFGYSSISVQGRRFNFGDTTKGESMFVDFDQGH